MLALRIDEVRQQKLFGVQRIILFREAATRYLKENMHLRTIGGIAVILKRLDRYIGEMPLNMIHMGTLQTLINDRLKDGVTARTVNKDLEVIRRVLNLSARLWRDESGRPWLNTPPMIVMLPLTNQRQPYPLSWDEQRHLFQLLPDYLARMCLFKVNTGCREQEVARLRWEDEVVVPEMGISVFIISGDRVKNGDDRVVVLNEVAKSVIDEQRGKSAEWVFPLREKPISRLNNSAWRTARAKIELDHLRIHDLKHTYGRRLRAAGVPHETRQVLLGHKTGSITTHYSGPELQELISASNLVCQNKFGKSPSLVILQNGRRAVSH